MRSDFVLNHERAHVVRLCRLVEGMPQAIELAASWLKLLLVAEVVVAIERDLDLLATKNRDVPERHRSMRRVLNESWRLLAADERQVLARLTSFQDGFSAPAAEAVAGATLATLSALVEQSLIRAEPDGRFHMHELLRQYGAEQLRSDPDEAE